VTNQKKGVVWREGQKRKEKENEKKRTSQKLTSSIPKGKLDMLSINLHISDVVLEHCGDVDL